MFFTKLPLLIASSFLSLAAADRVPAPTAADTEIVAPRSGAGKKAEGHGKGGMCEQIGCSDAQRNEIAEIRKAAAEKLRATKSGLDIREALAAAMREDDLTQGEAAKVLGLRDAAHDARREILADSLAQMHDVLDAKQRAHLATMIEKHGAKAVLGGHGHGDKHGKKAKTRGGKPEGKKADKGGGKKAEKSGSPRGPRGKAQSSAKR